MKIRQFLTPRRRLSICAALLVSFFVVIPCELAAQDDPSQRMLSLPDRQLPELKQSHEFLKKLRSLMESRQQPKSESASATDPQPSVNPGQFEELRNALHHLKEQLPPGFVPPDLSAVPPEQLKKALENPAVQQKMRDLLKQFSEDGVIPPAGSENGTELPLPRRNSSDPAPEVRRQDPRRSERSPGARPPRGDADDSKPDGKSNDREERRPPVLPPESMKSLQEFLQQLADSDFLPKQQRSGEAPLDRRIPDADRSGVDRLTPDESPVPRLFPNLPPAPKPKNPADLDDAGFGIPKSGADEQNREPSPGSSDLRSNQASEDANVLQQRSFKALQELLDQMAGPLKQQPDPSVTPEVAPRSGLRPAQSGQAVTPPEAQQSLPSPDARPPVPQTGAPDSLSTPPMDIRGELERNGFGGTIRKLVEKAKQQSRQPKSSDGEPSDPAGPGQTEEGSGSGLEQSVIRLLDGMKDDLVEIAKDGNFREPSRRNEPRKNRSLRPLVEPQSESALNRVRKSVSEFFSGPSQNPQQNASRGTSPSASGISTPMPEIQFDLTPVAVLAGLLGASAAGFFGLRFLKLRSADAIHSRVAPDPIAPEEIQNRADVIRAFHEFAMRSTKSVQSWWTHRAVERVMITASPEKRVAVETLAKAYELARYLPQEVHMTSEQIQAARNALTECGASVPV